MKKFGLFLGVLAVSSVGLGLAVGLGVAPVPEALPVAAAPVSAAREPDLTR